jgi:FlaA1/EpsC-like NDP-sugar epimerase
VLLLAGALAAAIFASAETIGPEGFRHLWFDSLPLWVGVPFLVMFLMGTHHRVWTRARLSEHVYLACGLLGGVALAAGLASLAQPFKAAELGRRALVYAGMAIPLLTGIRAMPRAVEDAIGRHSLGEATLQGAEPTHTLVHGARQACALYLNRIGSDAAAGRSNIRVVGLLDPDRNLLGRSVLGYRVLGDIEMLPELIKDHHLELLVLTDPVDDDVRLRAIEIGREHGITVSEQRTTVDTLVGPDAGGRPAG